MLRNVINDEKVVLPYFQTILDKQIHIYMNDGYKDSVDEDYIAFSHDEVMTALNKGCGYIPTTQTCCCSTTYLLKGYRIFVYMLDGEFVEIKLGDENKNTDRAVRVGQNIEKMLLANVFGYAVRSFDQ